MKRFALAAIILLTLSFSVVGLLRVSAGGGSPSNNICPDFTGDGRVLVADIMYVVNHYFTDDPSADLDASGWVFINDVVTVVNRYFQVCTLPTPINTPYDIGDASGPVPAGYSSWQEFADDAKDRILGNGGAGGMAVGSGWINLGCEVSPDCIAPNGSTITIHSDGSAEISVEPVQ